MLDDWLILLYQCRPKYLFSDPRKPLVLSDQLLLLTNPTVSVVSGVEGQDPIIIESPKHKDKSTRLCTNKKLNQKKVNQQAVFIPTGKGNAFLQDEQGYYYMKNRTSDKDSTIYWRCKVHRKYKCKVKVVTKGFNITLMTHEHNHEIIPLKDKMDLDWKWVVDVTELDWPHTNLWTYIWQWHLIWTLINLELNLMWSLFHSVHSFFYFRCLLKLTLFHPGFQYDLLLL